MHLGVLVYFHSFTCICLHMFVEKPKIPDKDSFLLQEKTMSAPQVPEISHQNVCFNFWDLNTSLMCALWEGIQLTHNDWEDFH